MNKKNFVIILLCLALAVSALSGCGAQSGGDTAAVETVEAPVTLVIDETPAPSNNSPVTEAADINGLLAAIKPGATILLTGNSYELSKADDYGKTADSSFYRWDEVFDGYELCISNVQGLSIIGTNKPVIDAEPRYANVITFENCENIYLENFTAGHTKQAGHCAGGVIALRGCSNVSMKYCGLYGCGILGVDAMNCKGLSMFECEIYECSYGAVQLYSCENVVLDGCTLRDCGKEEDFYNVITASMCEDVYILNSAVRNNHVNTMLDESYCRNLFLAGCTVENNSFKSGMFSYECANTSVISCSFENNAIPGYYESDSAVCYDAEGNALTEADFAAMSCEKVILNDIKSLSVKRDEVKAAENRSGYFVSTVDEFLAAIGPDRTIILADGVFNLSDVSAYSNFDSKYYYWSDCYDGPELVITGVSNFAIFYTANNVEEALGCTIAAVPRYANVLSFENCDHIVLSGFTAGHTQEPGECSGGVLSFTDCSDVYIDNCRMYGCGTIGISAYGCSGITVAGSEIYECSFCGVTMWNCGNAEFENTVIRDIGAEEMLAVYECRNVKWNGERVGDGTYRIVDNEPEIIIYEEEEYEPQETYRISLFVDGEEVSEHIYMNPTDTDRVTVTAKSNRPADGAEVFEWFCMSPWIELNPSQDGSECEITLHKAAETEIIVLVKQGSTQRYFGIISK